MTSLKFISYSSIDRDFAWKLADDLENAGHNVWIDRTLRAGDKWEQTIEENLSKADDVIVVLSPEAIASKWVQYEGSMAYALKKKMYPVRYKAFKDEELPIWARKVQYHEFEGVEYKAAFEALNAVLTPPNPIQDLLDQRVSTYPQTGELLGEHLLSVIEEARETLIFSDEADELINKSWEVIHKREREKERLQADKDEIERQRLEEQKQANVSLRRRNQLLIGILIIAVLFGIGAFFLESAHVN